MEKTLLALDTSTLSLSLAVVRIDGGGGARVLAERFSAPGPNHSKLLPLLVDEALSEAGVTLAELSGIAVGIGPGAFTGLRIALSTAKGIAWAARLPLAGASGLEAMALRAARASPDAGSIVPLLDARKQEVYAGFYAPSGQGVSQLSPEVVAPPAEVAAKLASLPRPLLLLGEGYFAYRTLFDEATEGFRRDGVAELPESPMAAEIAELAAPGMLPFDKQAVFSLEPRYLRQSEAELKLKGK